MSTNQMIQSVTHRRVHSSKGQCGETIKIIQKLECFNNLTGKKQIKNIEKSQHTQQQNQRDSYYRLNTGVANQNNTSKLKQETLITQLLKENSKLKEQNEKKNKLIEMLIEQKTDLRRVTSLHLPSEKEGLCFKSSNDYQSPSSLEFTFYRSPSKGLPKEFRITPSRKLFF